MTFLFIVVALTLLALPPVVIALWVRSAALRRKLDELRSEVKDNERRAEAHIAALTSRLFQLESRHVSPIGAATVATAAAPRTEESRPAERVREQAAVAPAYSAIPMRNAVEPKPPEPQKRAIVPGVAAAAPVPEMPAGATPIPRMAPQAAVGQAGPANTPLDAPATQVAASVAPLVNAGTGQAGDRGRYAGLEEKVGANWLNKLGVVILVIGLAFFLAYRLQTMGPAGKVLTGYAVSLALLGAGVWLERMAAYRVFASGAIGGGWALGFFTTYAMNHIAATRVLHSVVLDLVLMLAVAAAMVAHSLRYKSQTVTGLAFLLGFATLATSHVEAASGTIAFSMWASAVLATALVVVTARRHWAWLEFTGMIAVLGSHFLWLWVLMRATAGLPGGFPLFWQSTGLVLFYWAIFRAGYLLRKPVDAAEERISTLAAVVLSGGVLGLLKYQSHHPEYAFWALLAMGSVEMALGWPQRTRRRTAFVVLTTIATVLLVSAVPFRFHGVSWPVLWLVEAQVLAVCGLRLGEPVFRRLGLVTGLVSGVALGWKAGELAVLRLVVPDASHHWSLAAGLGLAAGLYWLHGEVYPRRWPDMLAPESEWSDWERLGLAISSWLGAASAAAALWVVLPAAWVAPAWLGLVVLLGLAADWKAVVSLSLQADLLALVALWGLWVWDTDLPAKVERSSIARWPVLAAVVLLFPGMRRRTVLEASRNYAAPLYSWAGSLLLTYWIAKVIDGTWPVLAWVGLALVLLEAGKYCKRGYLRWQAAVPALAAFCQLWAWQTNEAAFVTGRHGWFWPSWMHLASMAAVVGLGYWWQERVRESARLEPIMGVLAGTAASLTLVMWLPLLAPTSRETESATVVWAVLAAALLGTALAARRRVFQVHGIAVAVLAGIYGMVLAGIERSDVAWNSWESPLMRMGATAAILLAGLVLAFRLRRAWADETWSPGWLGVVARRPEQWFFFVPYALMAVTLAEVLRAGNITLGWSLLGLGAFVFAILVGERSFRLGGLVLLLLSVVKVLLMDVWRLEPADRYTTLIVMGCALLLVSFLYTRFRSVLQRYL